ncbi:MAG TPA: prolyl oligopeptidase family serine peptidase [Verrucomicrobiae bacterium]|nr:prolyl oligopeptidase family serine peptidase [Verrucomicrobiae bacterium]
MFRLGYVLVAVGLAASGGCASYEVTGPSHAAVPLPADIQRYYDYTSGRVTAVARATEIHSEYTVRDITLSPEGSTEPIHIEWFAPNTTDRSPLILISPIRGSDTIVVDGCARVFASCGYHAAIVKRARFHYDPSGPLTQVEDLLRNAVIRHRQALDWLIEQPGVDPGRVAAFGVSYGAIITSVVAAVDPRIRACVLDLAGGPLAGVMRTSLEPNLRRDWNRSRRCHSLTDRQLYRMMNGIIHTDPVKLAPYLPRDHVLMLIARFDSSVPTQYQVRLWRALGKPRADFVPFGHYTSMLALPAHRLSIMHFFEENLECAAPDVRANSIQARN